jgi:UDP-glucuronate 4-epimerase
MAPSTNTALVTGAAGFIGSTLVDRLLADGWAVTAIDGFDPFYDRERKLRHLAQARGRAGFSFVEVDTRDADGLRAVFRKAEPTVVFDLAARAGVRPSIQDPLAYVDINVRGLVNTLAATAEAGSRFVFASSSSIYGNDDRRPYREDQAQGAPVSPYGATKVAGEALVQAHHALTGLPIGIARLFTVYGPRQRPDLAIYTFASRILRGEEVELYGSGRVLRDYTYVEDTVDGLLRLGETKIPRLVVNLGCERPLENGYVVDQLESALRRMARRVLLPPQPGDVDATFSDSSRAAATLGWTATTPFETGIERFAEWFQAEEGRAA